MITNINKLKIGDRIIVLIGNKPRLSEVYGEVYEPLYWEGSYPGPSHLSAIEVYIDGTIYEFPINEVKLP